MSTTIPITRSTRQVTLEASAAQTVFTFNAGPVWDTADLVVQRKISPATRFSTITTGFTLAQTGSPAGATGATCTFSVAPRPTVGDPAVQIRISSRRVHERETDFSRAGRIHAPSLETEFDKETTTLQELRRDIDQNDQEIRAAVANLELGLPPENSLAAAVVDFISPTGNALSVQDMLASHIRQAREFGILPENSAAQNATGFAAMVSWLNINGGFVEFEAADYTVDCSAVPAITINGGGLIGQGSFAGGTRLRNASATGDTLVLDGAQHVLIRDIWFHPAVFRNAGTFEVTMTDSAYCCRVEDCRVDYAANAFQFLNASECEVINCQTRYIHDSFGFRFAGTAGIGSYRARLENFKANNPYPTSVYGTVKTRTNSTAYSLNDIVAVNGMVLQCTEAGTTSGTAPTTFPQTTPEAPFFTDITDGTVKWRFVFRTSLQWIVQDSFAYSLVIQKAAVINGYRGFAQFDGVASGSSYPIWCWADGLECDHSYSENVLLSGGEGFYASLSWFGSAMTGNAVTVGSSHKGEVTFASGTRIAAAWQHGIYYAAGPRACLIDGAFIGANSVAGSGTYHGVLIDTAAAGVQISGAKIGLLPGIGTNNQGYGVNNLSSVAGALRIDAATDLSGNVTGAVNGVYSGFVDNTMSLPLTINTSGGALTPPILGTVLHLAAPTGEPTTFNVDSFNVPPRWNGRRANGPPSAKTAVITNDALMTLTAQGYYTSPSADYGSPSGSFQFIATENFTSTAWGTRAAIFVTPNGSTTRIEAASFDGTLATLTTDLSVSRSNAGGAVQIAAVNSATGASVSARMSMQTGTANSVLNIRLADNTGSPFAIEECGTAVTAKYFNYPLHIFRSQAGTEWARISGTSMLLAVPLRLPSYTVGTVPSAAISGAGAEIYVTNESGGAVPAFSDGTNWRRVTDRAVIS
jgi:hypothetical protein